MTSDFELHNARGVERKSFVAVSSRALEQIERRLGALEADELDVLLAADVLTLSFGDGSRFIINAHSAASQIWMAADRTAWHFDYVPASDSWIASKTGEELFATVARVVGQRLGIDVHL